MHHQVCFPNVMSYICQMCFTCFYVNILFDVELFIKKRPTHQNEISCFFSSTNYRHC